MPTSPKHGIWILFVAMLAGACDDSPTPDVGGVVDAGMPPASDSGPPPAVDAGPPPEPVGSFAFDSGDSALTFGSAIAVADPSATDPRDVTYRILASTEYGLDCTHVDTSFPDWPVARPTAGIDGHPVMVVELGTYSAWVGAGVSATASCNGERCSLANWGAADIYNPGLFYDTSCLFDPARSELGDATSVWVQCFVSGLSTPPARFEIRATVCR